MIEETETSYPDIRQSWGIAGICILSMVLLIPVSILLNPVAGKEASFLVYYLLAMGAAFYFAHCNRQKKTGVSEYNFGPGSARIMVLVSIAVIALQTGIITPLTGMVPMPEFMKNIFREVSGRNIFSFLTLVIAAPIFEELIFRGIILDGLLKKYSPTRSIVISSILFAVVHLNPWQFIAAFVIGIFSGWVYYKTSNLTLSILIHAVNNLMAFISMSFLDGEAMLDKSLLELYGGSLNLILVIVGAVAVAAISIHYIRIEIKKTAIDFAST
jgi:Predicted metal-dependent membrane protease